VTDGAAVVGIARAMTGVGALLIVSGLLGVAWRPGVNSSAAAPLREIAMTPPHTAQRARTALPGMREGSTLKTDRHSGHETFTVDLAKR
jgi:hypothetical protein